jgi:hypothetical protein
VLTFKDKLSPAFLFVTFWVIIKTALLCPADAADIAARPASRSCHGFRLDGDLLVGIESLSSALKTDFCRT